MVLWCNGLAFKNHFKMFLLNFKKCNVRNNVLLPLFQKFCCLPDISFYQNVSIGYLAV